MTPFAKKKSAPVGSDAPVQQEADAVLDQHEFLSCLLDYIPDRIYFKDRKGSFLLVSRAEAEYLNAGDPADVIGKSDHNYFEPLQALEAFDDEQEVMRSGNSIMGKVEKKELLDGRTGWALVAKIPLRDSSGQIVGTCGISKDITALKETESALQEANATLDLQKAQAEESLKELNTAHEQLKEAQQRLINSEKAEGLSRLAFGVAHEIRNPLSTVEMGIKYLSNRPAITEDDKLMEMLQGMSDAIERADLVISALMDGARSSGVDVKPGDVGQIVQLAITAMKEGSATEEEALEEEAQAPENQAAAPSEDSPV